MANTAVGPEMTVDQQALVVAHMPLARKLANAYRERYPSHIEDLRQVAMLTLCQRATRWDASGAPFGSYATPYIRGALKNHVDRVIERAEQALPDGLEVLDPAPPVDADPPVPHCRLCRRPLRVSA